jgi:6-phosphofructo-2-kinase
MSNLRSTAHAHNRFLSNSEPPRPASATAALPVSAPPKGVQDIKDFAARHGDLKPPPHSAALPLPHPASHAVGKDGVGIALSDTPLPSHPGSPHEYAAPCVCRLRLC